MNFRKIKGFNVIFTEFIRPLFNKSVVKIDDISIKATANNYPQVNITSQKVSAL